MITSPVAAAKPAFAADACPPFDLKIVRMRLP
jgi:hypothetical protein